MIAIEHPLGFLSYFASHILIVPLNISVSLPNGFARLLVERNRILQVNSVECENYELVGQYDRRRRPAIVTTFQIVALPKNIAGCCVDARGAIAAEMGIHAARL